MHLATRIKVGQQALRQRRKVAALSQGWQMNSEAIDTVVKIATETSFVGGLPKILMGSAYQREIDIHRLSDSEGCDLAFL